jgi:hypothetical protein
MDRITKSSKIRTLPSGRRQGFLHHFSGLPTTVLRSYLCSISPSVPGAQPFVSFTVWSLSSNKEPLFSAGPGRIVCHGRSSHSQARSSMSDQENRFASLLHAVLNHQPVCTFLKRKLLLVNNNYNLILTSI